MYSVRILRDSINTAGDRLTTWELTYPRFVHAELMTHRVFSRNSASSRAIPIEKMIEQVIHNPAMPVWWGKNQSGMQAREELTGVELATAKEQWLIARDDAVKNARWMARFGVHKQIVNRLLEPWMWITVIVSATDFGNWFNLRHHKDAQPEIREVAVRMWELYRDGDPQWLEAGSWHLPLTGFEGDEKLGLSMLKKVSAARCARVSYLTHDGLRDVAKDLELHDRLAESGHWSPFEHPAMALPGTTLGGNFRGFMQYRKEFHNEHRRTFTGPPAE